MNENVFILIVDDNTDNLSVVGNFLNEKNYKIALATDSESALEVLYVNKIDLILLDVMLPGMNGFEFCKVLKANEDTRDIPVIFLTALTETADIVRGFHAGGVDYITKPFKKEELFARVDCHIQLKLIRDYLVENEVHARKSRDSYMRTLYDLGKILDRSK
jgi:two-component system, sensor histidine kinase and response regulator